MKQTLTFFIILLVSYNLFSQDKTFGVKIGYGISNAHAPNGTLLLRSNGTVGQDVSSFEYKPGYQIGITKRIELNSQKEKLHITGQYTTYGFKDNNSTIDLNYLELDINGFSEFGRKDNFYLAIGFGPAFLISNSNEIEISKKFDIRLNVMIGIKVLKQINLFAQGKMGWIGLSKESKIKSYMLSLNTEILLF